MSNIEIIKGVPLPPRNRSGGRKNVYPWDKLGVGDHFTFPKKVKKTTASSLAYRASRKVVGRKIIDGKEVPILEPNGKQFAIRVSADNIKCWRTA